MRGRDEFRLRRERDLEPSREIKSHLEGDMEPPRESQEIDRERVRGKRKGEIENKNEPE